MIEAGIPDFVALAWHGFYAPAGTPKAVIDIIYAALAKAMADPKVIAGLVASGIDSISRLRRSSPGSPGRKSTAIVL